MKHDLRSQKYWRPFFWHWNIRYQNIYEFFTYWSKNIQERFHVLTLLSFLLFWRIVKIFHCIDFLYFWLEVTHINAKKDTFSSILFFCSSHHFSFDLQTILKFSSLILWIIYIFDPAATAKRLTESYQKITILIEKE